MERHNRTLSANILDRPNTTESRRRARSICIDYRLDRRVSAQNTGHQGSEEEDSIPKFDIPPASKEATDPSLHATIMPNSFASSWIEAFTLLRANCIVLDLHSQHEQRWKGVCELEDAKSGHETGECADILLDENSRYIRIASYLN
jgi:hypothetical protein